MSIASRDERAFGRGGHSVFPAPPSTKSGTTEGEERSPGASLATDSDIKANKGRMISGANAVIKSSGTTSER